MDFIIPPRSKIIPSRRRFLFRAGMKDDPDIPKEIEKRLRLAAETGTKLADPLIFCEEVPVTINGVARQFLPRRLQGSNLVRMFVSSLGKAIDEEIADLSNQNKVLDATLLDAWASESLEAVNTWFDRVLRGKYGTATIRFSPGYGDMDITRNFEILQRWLPNDKIFADQKTGILRPRKSTICLIGWKIETGLDNE
ncbi:MAG: methionine synthase [Candidatus Cloacimonetes bacterium]|nr:methionine synthase [Candidatus Cloacimonadota bacterium]